MPMPSADALWAALAGVELGVYDRRIAEWLVWFTDQSTFAVLLSWLYRARGAGAAEACGWGRS